MKINFTIDDIKNITVCKELYNAFFDILKENAKSFDGSIFKRCNDIIYNYTKIYRNMVFEQDLSDSELYKIKKCIVVARQFYRECIKEKNEVKLITALCLISFYGQDFSLLSDISLSKEFVDKIHNFIKKISIEFNVGKEAGYSEHKRFLLYTEMKMKSDFSNILRMMDQLGNSPYIFKQLNYTWGILFQWIWFIDRNFIFEVLEESTPEITETIFWSLKENLFNVIVGYHTRENIYPILRGFMFLFHFYDETLQKQKLLNLQDLQDCTDWLIDILHDNRINVINYIDSMRITHLTSFNYFFGKVIAKDASLLDVYLPIADMNCKQSQVFSDSFLNVIKSDQTFLEVGEKIVKKYFESQIQFNDKINKEIGYLNLLVIYFSKKYNTKEKYIKKMADVSGCIIDVQNSWSFEKITRYWILLFYLALANNLLNFFFSQNEIQNALPILFDRREEIICGKKNIDSIKRLLTSGLENVVLSNQNNDVEVCFNKQK